ncbi:nucleotide exchange factor GrpE [Streptomyces sp. NPDC017941]|uniref:nucleotide exchange factor GrpE n=1 Tax=Streptomyces sp. NPDC017941 TaxID=3365018 RepID=UPI0037AB82CC
MNPMDPPEPPAPDPDPDVPYAVAALAAYEGSKALAARDAAHRAHIERLLLVCADALDACGQLLADGTRRDPATYHHALELVARQLESAVSAEGLEVFGQAGERAAPATHRIVEMRPAPPGVADDEVLEVVRRGYRYQGQVLRPARVVVASTAGAEEGQRPDPHGPPDSAGSTPG